MKKTKVLFVSQEITPYLPETHLSRISRDLPQSIQEKGREIRTFMPRYGLINERRNQLHEVIRLSGMNLIIDDNDQPLIIKVASIQSARMQVYFIDNEEYFQRKNIVTDKNGEHFEDNDERMLFFCKGVIETVKKLGWSPDIIHCHGWITALLPSLIKRNYKNDPLFSESRVVYSLYNDAFNKNLNPRLNEKLILDGLDAGDVDLLKEPSHSNLSKHAIRFSDGLILGNNETDQEALKFARKLKKPILDFSDSDQYADVYSAFYDEVLLGVPEAEYAES